MKTPEEWVREWLGNPANEVGRLLSTDWETRIAEIQADARAEPEAALASLRGKVRVLTETLQRLPFDSVSDKGRLVGILRAMLEGE